MARAWAQEATAGTLSNPKDALNVMDFEPRRQTLSRDRIGPPGYVTRRRFANWRVCVSWSVATRQFIHDIKNIPPRLYYIGEEGRGA